VTTLFHDRQTQNGQLPENQDGTIGPIMFGEESWGLAKNAKYLLYLERKMTVDGMTPRKKFIGCWGVSG